MRKLTIVFGAATGILALCAAPAWANLLVNGDFETVPPNPDAQSLCTAGWSKAPGTNNCMFDGTTWGPSPANYQGSHHGSTDIGTNAAATAIIYQPVNVLQGGMLHFTGVIGGGTGWDTCNPTTTTFFIRLHDGADYTAPVLDQLEVVAGSIPWTPANLSGTPSGTQVTVSWGYSKPSTCWAIVAAHADAFNLTQDQPACIGGDPVVTGFSPTYAANNANQSVTVTGTAFASDSQVFLRRTGFPDVQATGEVVNPEGTQITATLPLNGVAMGKWDLVVTKPNCNNDAGDANFIVANASLANGSFELPTAPGSCPNPPTQRSAPTGWLQGGISTGSAHLVRDANQFPPGCPRPDGDHYGSILLPQGTSVGHWKAYQYLAVTPGQPVSVCASFAGGQHTTVALNLREGDEDAELISSTTIENNAGCPGHTYDWVYGCVTGTPAGGLVTLEWRLEPHNMAGSANVSHADNFQIGAPPAEVCDNGIDDDGDRATDCQDTACAAFPGCDPAPEEICDNDIDDDGDTSIDCNDDDCDAVCIEICGNDIDDDHDCDVDEGCESDCSDGQDNNGDGLIDCDDPDCATDPACPQEVCNNGTDDDGDTLVDCDDPDCASAPECACNDPFADADGDGDVDQEDYGVWQLCFTGALGGVPTDPSYCHCFDRESPDDGDIDQTDYNAFQDCADTSGPEIPVDPACDDPPAE